MPKKITWRKGMRLSSELFDEMDDLRFDALEKVVRLASSGRYGLIPSTRPFDISVNISNNVLEVVSLSCLGVTKDGSIVDIEFDSAYTHTFDTRIPMSGEEESESYLLVVRVHKGEWREIDENRSETGYTFDLVGENTAIGDDMLPVGRVIFEYGWRLDEAGFLPPCLYVRSHPHLEEAALRAKRLGDAIAGSCLGAGDSQAKMVILPIWLAASDIRHRIDKEFDSLTPGSLFAMLQKMAEAFITGFALEPAITLSDPELFVAYYNRERDLRREYADIRDGLDLLSDINARMEDICSYSAPTPPPQPQPKPKPKPKPPVEETEEERRRRLRWEGLEI